MFVEQTVKESERNQHEQFLRLAIKVRNEFEILMDRKRDFSS